MCAYALELLELPLQFGHLREIHNSPKPKGPKSSAQGLKPWASGPAFSGEICPASIMLTLMGLSPFLHAHLKIREGYKA